MAKRKATNDVLTSPKKEKNNSFDTKVVKQEKAEKMHVSSESDQEDFEDNGFDQTEVDDSRNDGNQSTYDPDEMRLLAESFVEFLSTRSEKPTVHNMERYVADWSAEARPEDPVDASLFVIDFKKYLKNAIKQKNFPLNEALSVVINYVGGTKALGDFKTFPGNAPKRVQMYMKKKKLPNKVGAELAVAARMMREEDAGFLEELEEELRLSHEQHISELQAFIDSHPNLTEAQQQVIKKRITYIEKCCRPKAPPAPRTPKTPKKKGGKKEPETAFTLFCRTKTDKYRDLSEEAREKKLQKKFSKLSTAELDLLESLAMNS